MNQTHSNNAGSEGAHARLSPSGAVRWMACPGSLVLEQDFPRTSSNYADAGTAMHAVAAYCLTEHRPASKCIGTKVPVHTPGELTRVVVFTDEMAQKTQGYVDTIRFLSIGAHPLIEHRVDFSNWVSVPGQFGTADAIVVLPIEGEPDSHELCVIDLKTGFVRVDPEENAQGMCYALGALNLFELSHNITRIRVGIYQPAHGGLSEWTCTTEHLLAFADRLKTAAGRVEQASSVYQNAASGMMQREWEDTFLNPSPNEDECRHCRAMPTCPAAARVVESAAGASVAQLAGCFDDLTAPPVLAVSGASGERLSLAMKACGFLEDFAKSVRAETERRLLVGELVDGFGLELGRQGARKWADEAAAEQMVRKQFRLKIDDAFDFKLKSPTTFEKMASGKEPVLRPKQWTALQALIHRSPASPSVRPAKDIKIPYTVPVLDASTFDPVEETNDLT